MFNYQAFDEVFDFNPAVSYDEDTIADIEANRKSFDGVLFIDKILRLLGTKRPLKYYPPKSNTGLRDLHKLICDTTGADHHKISLLYYVLIDLDYPTGKREHSTALEQKAFLPQKYGTYMKGLWHLDYQQYESAVQYLTYPTITANFPDEILETLVRKSKDHSLALAYYYTVQPTLTSSSSIECLFTSIVRSSPTEAYFFARSQSQYAHRHMFEMLISYVLNNSPQAQLADRATELVKLPFDVEEEEWFHEYLTRGEGTRLRKAKDTVLMRAIGTGKYQEGLELKGVHGKNIGGLDWSVLLAGLENGLGPRGKDM